MHKNLYLFYGEEDYLIDNNVHDLKSKIVAPETETFGYQCLDDKNGSFDEIINAIQTIPVFTPARLVVLRNPSVIFNGSLSEKQEEILLNSLKNIPAGVFVVFQISGNIDFRKKIAKFLKEKAQVVECKAFADWEQDKLITWLKQNLAEKGYIISEQAALLLAEVSGMSLAVLNGEVEKLITYIGSRNKVEVADIEAIASQGEISGFALNEAITSRDIKGALVLLSRIIKDGNSPIMILAMLVNQARLLLQIKQLSQSGDDYYAIAAKLKKNPYYIKNFLTKSSKYSFNDIKEYFYKLQEADYKIKTGLIKPDLALELTLSSLIERIKT